MQHGELHDLIKLGDIADSNVQRQASGEMYPPHDLLPRWFVQLLIIACALTFVAGLFFQPAPFWWCK